MIEASSAFKKMSRYLSLLFGMLFLMQSGLATAKPLFQLDITSSGITKTRTFNNVSDSFDGLDRQQLVSAFSGVAGFDPDRSAITTILNYRGIPLTITTAANSNTLVLDIPGVISGKQFTGATRDESIELLKDFFKKDGGSVIDQLFKKTAELTPIDPIAGNPNSLMSRTIATSYDRGFTDQVSQIQAYNSVSTEKGSSNSNLVTIGARYSNYDAGGYKSQNVTLPLSYTVRFDDDPRQQITFNLPIDMVDTEGGKSYSVGLGFGYSHPLTQNWVITPSFDYGVVGSIDLGSAGQAIAASLTSAYTAKVGDVTLSMGNMVNYSRSLRVSIGDYSFDPGISNTVLKNGLLAYIPTDSLISNTGVELFFADTRFLGSKLFIDNSQEVGFSYGLTRAFNMANQKRNKYTNLRVGMTYVFAKESDGFSVNFGYTF